MSRVKVTREQMKALGLDVPSIWGGDRGARKRGRPPDQAKHEQRLFLAACKSWGLPVPVLEYQFALPRKWAIDALFDSWLALEIEGSPWIGKPCPVCKQRSGGRHNHGQGFLDDMEKYNEITIRGFALIRCTREQIASGAAFALIKRALEAREEQPFPPAFGPGAD